MAAPRIRVLLVDDSALCRTVLRHALESDPEIEVVGEAEDGVQALRKVELLRPSLVCLDIQMPRMGGLETIERIMGSRPTPILVVTERPRVEGVDLTFASLSRGALDLVQKPASSLGGEEMNALVARVKVLARSGAAPSAGAPGAAGAVRLPSGPRPQVVDGGAAT
ncbi:MAG: response regulator, partial [Myxococcales bacterium]